MKKKSKGTKREAAAMTAGVNHLMDYLFSKQRIGKKETAEFRKLSHGLHLTFNQVWPDLDSDMYGTVSALLVDVFCYSTKIRAAIGKLASCKRPSDAETLRSFISDLDLLYLGHQKRYIAELRREIPKLLRNAKDTKVTQSKRRGNLDQFSEELERTVGTASTTRSSNRRHRSGQKEMRY